MRIGIPKEIKNNEYRVSATPDGVRELVIRGHEVFVEKNAGIGSGFSDEKYIECGAVIIDTAKALFEQSTLIVKVKEPLEQEYSLLNKNHILFTYLHLAASESLTRALMKSGATCIAYETVQNNDGSLPLLTPMSMVAGRLAVLEGTNYLKKFTGGVGKLIGGVPGVKPAKVVILGGGVVGTEAAKMAAGLGAEVLIFDVNTSRLRELSMVLPPNVKTIFSTHSAIAKEITDADLVIGAVLLPGAKAPSLITKAMLSTMQKGSVIVDVAVDQGGCIETCKPTTHQNPVYVVDGVIHYCVANMPGAVPNTSTLALTNVTLPYIIQIADVGWAKASAKNTSLLAGLNVEKGKVVYKPVADLFGL